MCIVIVVQILKDVLRFFSLADLCFQPLFCSRPPVITMANHLGSLAAFPRGGRYWSTLAGRNDQSIQWASRTDRYVSPPQRVIMADSGAQSRACWATSTERGGPSSASLFTAAERGGQSSAHWTPLADRGGTLSHWATLTDRSVVTPHWATPQYKSVLLQRRWPAELSSGIISSD